MHADDFVLLTGQWPHTPVLEIIGAPLLLFGPGRSFSRTTSACSACIAFLSAVNAFLFAMLPTQG
jgi:hypothetical protein